MAVTELREGIASTRDLQHVDHFLREEFKDALSLVDHVLVSLMAAVSNHLGQGLFVRFPEAIVLGLLLSSGCVILEEACPLVALLLSVAEEPDPLAHRSLDVVHTLLVVFLCVRVELTLLGGLLQLVGTGSFLAHLTEVVHTALHVGAG